MTMIRCRACCLNAISRARLSLALVLLSLSCATPNVVRTTVTTHLYKELKNDKEWKKAVYDKSYVVTLNSSVEEDLYEKKNDELNDRIKKVCHERLQRLGLENLDFNDLYVSDNWWPSQCRYMDVSTRVLSHEFLEQLRALLTGEYKNWRIQVRVYQNMMNGGSDLGGLIVCSDRILVPRAVLREVNLIAQASQ